MAQGKYELINMSSLPVPVSKHDAQPIGDMKYPLELDSQVPTSTLLRDEPSPEATGFWTKAIRLFYGGWRAGLIRWTVLSTGIWLVTIIVYICLFATTSVRLGSGLLLSQSCTVVSIANTLIHLLLNVVTTMMLSASTYAMESLCCPTRQEIDHAHAKGRWLGIGGLSLRNFRFIRKRRSILWALLWVTSIPLHLFFNAVFFTSSETHQYAVAVVTQQYFTDSAFTPNVSNVDPQQFANLGGYLNQSAYDIPDRSAILDLLDNARKSNNGLATLDPAQCMSIYGNGFVRNAGDVVVVVTNSSTTEDLIWTRYPSRVLSQDRKHTNQDGFNWICHDILEKGLLIDGERRDRCTVEVMDYISTHGPWTVYGSPVQSCLSRPYPATCHLYFNVWLMLAVLVIGVFKTVIMIYIVFRLSREHNLRTFGDAVSSFLQHEDPNTKGMCLVPTAVFTKDGLKDFGPRIYVAKQLRWWRSAGVKQFWATVVSTILYAILFGVALNFAVEGAAGTAFDDSIGQTNIQSLAKVQADDASSSGIIPNLLVANIPQVGISLLYMAFNDVFSKMLMGDEFDRYTRQRKSLRVSEQPRGAQRGTRYFSLPARWALPQMIGGALLHWLASASLFAVRVDGVNRNGMVDLTDRLSRLGYNSRAIVALVAMLVLVAGALLYVGLWKRVDLCFGEAGNSLVISAACHPLQNDGDLHIREISWGDVTGHDVPADGVRHCSFSTREPLRPTQGASYA